jgi:exosortase
LRSFYTHGAVSFLANFGYPVAVSGVTIYINQFELLVAAACAGLNSLISLTAIGIFYVYVSHKADWRYTVLLMVAVVPVSILANFVRVVILVLLTYYLGDAAAQGFLHEFAGLTMFTVAVLSIFALDKMASSIRRLLTRTSAAT